MADTAADYRARAAADLAEAQQLVLPHARDRMLHSADRWSKMAVAADRRVR